MWTEDLDGALNAARQDGKPLLVFFTAYWASACKELEQHTLSDARVRPKLNSDFHLVKLDVTNDEDPRSKALLARLNVTGLPTVLVVDSREREKLRVIEFLTVDELLEKLGALR
jgi:thiol:disulfide interchange protein DsbD